MRPETLEESRCAAQRLASLLRRATGARLAEELVDLVDGLTELLADAPIELARPVGAALVNLVRAEERGDLARVADLLEFQLLPRLAPGG